MKRIGIITGASSGLGLEFALQTAEHFKVDELWLIARRVEKLEELSKLLKVKCRILPYDLANESSYNKFKELINSEKPQVTLLINNAGLGKTGLFKHLEEAHLKQLIMVNSYHPVIMTTICKTFFAKGSAIINVSSAASFSPLPKFSVYGASKAFVTSFSRALSEEYRRDKIKVVAVCPGPVATEFFKVDSNGKSNGFKVAQSKEVVKQAFFDLKRGKKLSIYGKEIKFAYFLSHLLPKNITERLTYFFKKV